MESSKNNTFHYGYRLAIEHVRTSMHRVLKPPITLYMTVVLDHVLNDFEYQLHDRPAGGHGAPAAFEASPGAVAQALVGTAVQPANDTPTSSELGGRAWYEPRRIEPAKHVAPANSAASAKAAAFKAVFKAAPAGVTTPTNPAPINFVSTPSSYASAAGTKTIAATSEPGPIVLQSPASTTSTPTPAAAAPTLAPFADNTATFVPLSAAEYAVANKLIKNYAGQILLPKPRLRPVTMRVHKPINITRPVNLEAVLAQSRGVRAEHECGPCAKGNGPFTECVVVPGMLRDSCSNCHYNHGSQKCTFRAAPGTPVSMGMMESPAKSTTADAGSPAAQKVVEDDAERNKKRKFDHEPSVFTKIEDDE